MSKPGLVKICSKGIKQGTMLVVLFLFFTTVTLFLSPAAKAEEVILNFHSDISVNSDGSLDVVEQITVNAEGRNIKRGIYRDLPTSYEHLSYGNFGFKSKTPVTVLSVQRNGKDEPYHSQDLSNGLRVFFGSRQRVLGRGEHSYTLHYRVGRQIALNDDAAQLYWNVTGNGWMFPILKASATVSLADTPVIHQQEVYTGYQGSSRSDAQFAKTENAGLIVKADNTLLAGEGMTIRVRFDAAEMSLAQESELALLYKDNPLWFWGAGMLLLMVLVFIVFWYRIGRDPQRGIIVAQYRPVEGLSAAAHRAVYRNRVDDTSFSVGVLSAAIKGWLTISNPSKKIFVLTSTEKANSEKTALSPSEEMLLDGLFSVRSEITLDGEYNSHLKSLKERYDKFLQQEFAKKTHQKHEWPLFIGGLTGVVGLILMALVGLNGRDDLIVIMAVVFTVIFILLSMFFRKKNGSLGYSLGIVGVALAATNLYFANIPMAAGFLVFGVMLVLFTYLMPAPKQTAVGMLDQIEGFKLYLSKAEHDSLKRLDLPEKTPQLYEELLPFAIALDLETQWSDQFTEVLAAANWDSAENSNRTHWYSGDNRSSMGSFAPAIAAGLATSVVAASTPPSSSSSGGGGGFSGGGGGGGGGGGW
jgi:uncharacterized membrane protein YgcG